MCYNDENLKKVMAGVVSHPVSEPGERGVSLAGRKRERRNKAELACRPSGQTAPVKTVAGAGRAR